MSIDLDKIKNIYIQKNRGWRGLARVNLEDKDGAVLTGMVFSFSQEVWHDLMNDGIVVVPYYDYYLVVEIDKDDVYKLPRDHQRSVLITSFLGLVDHVYAYGKSDWTAVAKGVHFYAIHRFLTNRNNHTTSEWNFIGVRVTPELELHQKSM